MSGFGEIEGSFVITWEKGVYRQVPIFERDGNLFAKQKGGFIMLIDSLKTSHPLVRWKEISGVDHKVGKFGYLEIKK